MARYTSLRAEVQLRMNGWCQRSGLSACAGVWGEKTAEYKACSFIPTNPAPEFETPILTAPCLGNARYEARVAGVWEGETNYAASLP